DRLAVQIVPVDQIAIGFVGDREDMVGTAKHGHEAGSLLEETAQIFALLVQHTVAPLDRIGPLQKVRLRFPVAADRAKTVKFRHVDGVLEDMAYISVTILDRRMRRTPVALFDAPFRAGDRIGNQGKMVDLAGLEYR